MFAAAAMARRGIIVLTVRWGAGGGGVRQCVSKFKMIVCVL